MRRHLNYPGASGLWMYTHRYNVFPLKLLNGRIYYIYNYRRMEKGSVDLYVIDLEPRSAQIIISILCLFHL